MSSRSQTSRTIFSNPFATINTTTAAGTTVPGRAARSTSTSSSSSQPGGFAHRATSPNLNDILALGLSTATRNASLTGSICSSRRPSCFSILEEQEEKAEFGDMIGLLEPRGSIGYWGVREVLDGSDVESRRGSLS